MCNGYSVDQAINACTGFNSLQDVIDKMVADCQNVGNSDTFLHDYCGIITDNDDSGAFTGWDAGGLTMKTTSDLLPQSGSATYPSSTTFTKRGLTITVPDKSTLSEKEQLIVKGFYSWWAEDAIKLIENTYGVTFSGQSISLSFVNQPDAFAWGYGGASGITVNMGQSASQNITEENIKNVGFSDLFEHEMTHVMQFTVGQMGQLKNYMREGMADLTAGDDHRGFEESAGNATTLNDYLYPNNSFEKDRKVYAAGIMFWRYLMKHVDNSSSTTQGGGGGGEGNPTTPGGGGGGEDNPTTPGGGGGGGDNPTTPGGGGGGEDNPTTPGGGNGGDTDTRILTAQNGIYKYTGGNKTVENYNSPEKVQLSSDFAGLGVDGNNFIVKSSSGALTLENVRDKFIDVTNNDGNTAAYIFMAGNGGEIAANALGDNPNAFKIIVGANNGSNILIAGDGGSSLIGGNSDDTLQGGIGKDTFIYNSGNDAVINYNSWEKVNFDANYTDWFTYDNALYINSDKGALKIDDAKDKLIEVADADGNVLAHVCMPTAEGTWDGRNFNEFVAAVGADNLTNQILAGQGGSSLWGGGGNIPDDLYGGNGADEFIYRYGDGNDNVFNSSTEDVVNFDGVSWEQVTGFNINEDGMNVNFVDGGSLNINGQAGRFKIAGYSYGIDYENKTYNQQ